MPRPRPHAAARLAPAATAPCEIHLRFIAACRAWARRSSRAAEAGNAPLQGKDPELTKSEDARTARSGSRCTRLVDGDTPRTVRCVPVFVRSQYSDALVGDGLLRFELCGQLRVHTLYECDLRSSHTSTLRDRS